jgi:glycosyltransferase involved in cell wall biosynthesis
MLSPSRELSLKSQKILLAHSNVGETALRWHDRRHQAALRLGYDVSMFRMADYHAHTIFPKLDRLWRKRDPALMRLYDALGTAIDACDVFIHYNGALVHPEFLQQFSKLTIYHCADDPDASAVISRPVASHYDICAISNPACIEMYKSWGCPNTCFWPLGSFSYDDDGIGAGILLPYSERDVPLVFIGSKLGVPSLRILGKYLGLYRKKSLMVRLERSFPELVAYGGGWPRGRIEDAEIPRLYQQSRIGFNLHNTLGPINGRLYDLAAFGVCQICDNKATLSLVFDEGSEIVGFESIDDCVELIRYYLAHPIEAERIGRAARARFLRDYSTTAIWKKFFADVENFLLTRNR